MALLQHEAAETGGDYLKRTLNGFSLMALGIIIGAGLFLLTGIAAAGDASGPR